MDFQATAQLLGNLGEFLGSIGVIATLIYLAQQVRFSARTQRTETQHQILAEFRRATSQLIDNPELGRAAARLARGEEIAEEIRAPLELYVSNQFRVYEELYLAHVNGNVDAEFWESRRVNIRRNFVSRPFVRRWWESWGARNFSAPFVTFVEELAAESAT